MNALGTPKSLKVPLTGTEVEVPVVANNCGFPRVGARGEPLRNLARVCAWLVLFSASCTGEEAGIPKTPDVAAYLQDKLAESVAAFGEKLEGCHRQAQNNRVPVLDKSEMQRIGANEEQIIVAIGHINFTNSFDCSRIERTALAFDLEMLNTTDASPSVDGKDLQELKRGLIYPSINEITYSVRYRHLPSELKAHIEIIAGDKPFDLLKALESNRLAQD